MMALKEKADKDLSQYNTELKELMRIIEHDRKLKEFMRIKSEERAEMMDGELSSQRKKKDEKERGDKAEETIEVAGNVYFVCKWLQKRDYDGVVSLIPTCEMCSKTANYARGNCSHHAICICSRIATE